MLLLLALNLHGCLTGGKTAMQLVVPILVILGVTFHSLQVVETGELITIFIVAVCSIRAGGVTPSDAT